MCGTYELLHTNAEGRYPYNYQNVRENADTRENKVTEAVYNKQKSRRRSNRNVGFLLFQPSDVNFREYLSEREREKVVMIRAFLVASPKVHQEAFRQISAVEFVDTRDLGNWKPQSVSIYSISASI